MIFKAYSWDQAKFLSLSETGMGYQVIEAKRSSKTYKEKFVVYNSELVVDIDSISEFKRQIVTKGYLRALNEAQSLSIETNTINLVTRKQITEFRVLTENKKKEKGRQSGGRGAIDNPKEPADGKEMFVRLSAYENDKRIDFENKKLRPGTYTTTQKDYLICVQVKDDPIDRYALPNDETIGWAFYIQPKTSDVLQRGIVQPAFGHDGGGIEAYFELGTSKDTYLYKKAYGQ